MISIFEALNDIGHSVSKSSFPVQIICPFHKEGSEVNPSARLYPDTDSFYCFACQKAYTPVSTLSTYYEISYSETLQKLAAQYGSTTPKRSYSGISLDSKLADLIKSFSLLNLSEKRQWYGELDLVLVSAARGNSSKEVQNKIKSLEVRIWPQLV